MSDDDNTESWLDAAEHAASAGLDVLGEGVQAVGEFAVNEVAAVGETAYHAGAAVYDGVTGDWDAAANQSLSMSESALNFVTGGALGAGEAAWDTGNAAAGGDEQGTAHGTVMEELQDAGNWLGDEAYKLTHPEEETQ